MYTYNYNIIKIIYKKKGKPVGKPTSARTTHLSPRIKIDKKEEIWLAAQGPFYISSVEFDTVRFQYVVISK